MEIVQKIIHRHGLTNDYLPLWKVIDKMDEQDKVELISYIDNNISNSPLICSAEVCLMYAYWWNKSYAGGHHTYREAPNSFGILNNNENNFARALQYEFDSRENRNRLGISLYKNDGGNRYLDSVLAQGGLPLNTTNDQTNLNILVRFCKTLVYYFKDMQNIDWNDITFASQLAEERNLPQYIKNESFYSFCMYITRMIVLNEQVPNDIESLRQLINGIRIVRNNIFNIEWAIHKNGYTAPSLCYSLNIPRTFHCDDENIRYGRSYYLNGKFVGEYNRFGQTLSLLPGASNIQYEPIVNSTILSLEKSDDNGPLHNVGLNNAIAPELMEPMVLYNKDGSYWVIDSAQTVGRMAILYPIGWEPDGLNLESIEIEIGNERYLWAEFDAWPRPNGGEIVFRNGEQQIVLRQGIQNGYKINVVFPYMDWIASSQTLLIPQDHRISNRSIIVYDENGDRVQSRSISISRKTENGYSTISDNEEMPLGLNIVRIELPNHTNKYIKLFCCRELTYIANENNASFRFDCGEGVSVDLCQDHGVVERDGSYSCDGNSFAVKFRLTCGGQFINVSVMAPKRQSAFEDWINECNLNNGDTIPINNLNGYKVYFSGNDRLILSLASDRLGQIMNIDIRNQFESENISLRNSEFSLGYIKETINKIQWLYRLSPSIYFTLNIRDVTIRLSVTPYVINCVANENRLIVTNNDSPVPHARLGAIRTSEINNMDFVEFDMETDEDGSCILPDELQTREFVVYSKDEFKPIKSRRLNLLYERQHHGVEVARHDANNIYRESIDTAKTVLNQGEWEHVWRLLEIVRLYNLPFWTFNVFIAITESPRLMCRFISRLPYEDNLMDEYVELLKRMEFELGCAFHCIPKETQKQQPQFMEKFDLKNKLFRHQFGDAIYCFWQGGQCNNGRIRRINSTDNDCSALILQGCNYWNTEIIPNDTNFVRNINQMANTIPQEIARYVSQGPNEDSWGLAHAAEKFRILNYIRHFAPNAYNNNFINTLNNNNN